MDEKTLFICDPAKNTDCPKSECHINGGECYCTTHEEYALDDAPEESD